MYLSAPETQALSSVFRLLAEDLAEREVRERVGGRLLDLLKAEYFASFVWDESTERFGGRVTLNMNGDTLQSYENYYQYRDPITFKLQERRVPTLVTQVMPQRELMRTEFFNDFLARDGLFWGVNAYSYVEGRNIGDLRIWRGRRRENFDAHTLDLLRLVEPAFTAALARASRGTGRTDDDVPTAGLSSREWAVARMVAQGRTNKEIARALGVELSTVRTYLARCCEKLGVRRRGGVAAAIGPRRFD